MSERRPRLRRRTATALAAAAVLVAAATAVAHESRRFEADLRPVPHDPAADAGSNVTGEARLDLEGRKLEIRVRAEGLEPGQHHLMHIHGVLDRVNSCPGPDRRDDIVDDGLIDVAEGVPDYGPVLVSLTEEGDTSAASGGALDRMPLADEDGELRYRRTFRLPADVARRIGKLHIVIHGEDLNGNAAYDNGLEIALPVTCGAIDRDD